MENEKSDNVGTSTAEAGRYAFRAGSSLPDDTIVQLRSQLCIVKHNGETYGIIPDKLLEAVPTLPAEAVSSEYGTIPLGSDIRVINVLTKDVVPELIKTIDKYNIVRYDGLFYVLPQSLGEVRWGEEDIGALPGVVTSRHLDEAFHLAKKKKGFVEKVREITTRRSASTKTDAPTVKGEPRLVGSLEGYNIVHYDGWYYGIPQALGEIDLRKTDPMRFPNVIRGSGIAEAEQRIRYIRGPANRRMMAKTRTATSQPRLVGSLEGYNVVEYEGWFYGLPQALGDIDLSQTDAIEMPGVIRDVTRIVVENEIREIARTRKSL